MPMPMAAAVAEAVKAALEATVSFQQPLSAAAVAAAVTAALQATKIFQQPAPTLPVAAERGSSVGVLVPPSAAATTASFQQPAALEATASFQQPVALEATASFQKLVPTPPVAVERRSSVAVLVPPTSTAVTTVANRESSIVMLAATAGRESLPRLMTGANRAAAVGPVNAKTTNLVSATPAMQLLPMKDTTVLPVGSLQSSPAMRNPEDLEPIHQAMQRSSASLDDLGGQEMQCGEEARVVACTNQQNHSVQHVWAAGNQQEQQFANLTSGIKR